MKPSKQQIYEKFQSSPENPLIAAYKARQQAALENQMKDASEYFRLVLIVFSYLTYPYSGRIRAESGSTSGDTPPISSPANNV